MSSNYSLRNSQLLQQVQTHPLKATLARCLDISETYAGDVEFLSLDKNLSAEGRRNAMQAKLRAAIRDLRDAKAPLSDVQKKLEQKRAAVAMPSFDKNDIVGFLRRQELRAALRSMANAGQRALLLEDLAFADAMLEQPPALSGLQPQQIGEDKDEGNQDFLLVEAVKKRRLESLFAPQLAEIDELEKTVVEVRAIADVARNDLQHNSGMERGPFEEFVKPVETKAGAPWLRKDADGTIRVIDLAAPGGPVGRVATADEARDGLYFKNHEEFLASRSVA